MNLARLLQLASPALPVGAYSYSQGLEWAVHAGTVHDEMTALGWIDDLLTCNVGNLELSLLARMLDACRDERNLAQLNEWFLASRETAELRAETLSMGYSLARLLVEIGGTPAALLEGLRALANPTFPAVWAYAAWAWKVDREAALSGYLWSWAENQVMAAIKTVPLGQTAGQRMLLVLADRIPGLVKLAATREPTDAYNFAPGFAIASSQHETQYSRLFRS